MSEPARESDVFTYGDYRRWPDDLRCELIGGVVYDMCPAPTRSHQRIAMKIATQISNFLGDGPCEVYAAPFDVRLPKANEADDRIDTVVQPDISVICDPAKLDEAGCRGAPDWIIEILSPRTAAKDQKEKRDAYERAGVREYWLVHPTDLVLTIYRLADGAYGRPEVQSLAGETPVAVIPGLSIVWPEPPPDSPPEGAEAAR